MGLRAMLRQDPDVVMVGEIRDLETVEIAIQASLTGHLVLSTLHTNTAVGAVTRLVDMGVEPFLLSSSLIGVLAQRLVRFCVLISSLIRPMPPSASSYKWISANPPTLYHPQGCEECNHHGYKGRTGIYELIEVDEGLRGLIHNRASEANSRPMPVNMGLVFVTMVARASSTATPRWKKSYVLRTKTNAR